MITLLRILGMLSMGYGLARLAVNQYGLLARNGWSDWFVGGLFAVCTTVLVQQLTSGRRRSRSLFGRAVPFSGTIAVNVRDRRSQIRKCTISRRTEGWLVELFDRHGDFVGKGEAPAYAGTAGPDSFLLADVRGNRVGQCDVKSSDGVTELVARDRDGVLLARGRFSARSPQPPRRIPMRRPSRTYRPA